jgi:predicted dehydrogenase
MSQLLKDNPLWLVGAGPMAADYARVLTALGVSFEVIGRGRESAFDFENSVDHPVRTGGLEQALANSSPPKVAIVAVGVEQLAQTAASLVQAGTKRILLEKPGGLNVQEIVALDVTAKKHEAEIFLAYNRRFYQSVQAVREGIEQDGGLLSLQFEFTEWSHKIGPLVKAPGVKEHWVLGNSSHVIDLAFYLAGKPADWKCWHHGSTEWHPSAARFAGAGVTDRGVMFSYLSDWQAPGRWGLELLTSQRRFVLRPMEQLQVTLLGCVNVDNVELQDKVDESFKPGLYRQTEAFLSADVSWLCSLDDQVRNVEFYSEIAGYV